MKIGFIGTGTMGKPMAKNILKSNQQLCVYARHPGKVEDLVSIGAQSVGSPAELANQCEFIILSLPFDPEVSEIITGKNGILMAAKSGTMVIDTTTGTPQNSIEMAAVLAKQSIDYIDAPISGGVNGAIDGTLTFECT